ncbi:MAG: hypothetical protein ACSLE8_21175 [Rhodococcus sp. (in: high G+C Gram-positive bacteria)]
MMTPISLWPMRSLMAAMRRDLLRGNGLPGVHYRVTPIGNSAPSLQLSAFEAGRWATTLPSSPSGASSDCLGTGVSCDGAQFELDPDLVGVATSDPSSDRWFLVVADGDPVARLVSKVASDARGLWLIHVSTTRSAPTELASYHRS